jgi:hypothetical protein
MIRDDLAPIAPHCMYTPRYKALHSFMPYRALKTTIYQQNRLVVQVFTAQAAMIFIVAGIKA